MHVWSIQSKRSQRNTGISVQSHITKEASPGCLKHKNSKESNASVFEFRWECYNRVLRKDHGSVTKQKYLGRYQPLQIPMVYRSQWEQAHSGSLAEVVSKTCFIVTPQEHGYHPRERMGSFWNNCKRFVLSKVIEASKNSALKKLNQG